MNMEHLRRKHTRCMTFESITEAIKGRKFQPSKPIREIRPIDLQRNPEIIGSRKYNGNFSTAIANRGGVDFYTASNLPLANLGSKRWAGIPYWRYDLQTLPCETILLGEIHIPNTTIEDLEAFQEWYTWHINGFEGTENNRRRMPPIRCLMSSAGTGSLWLISRIVTGLHGFQNGFGWSRHPTRDCSRPSKPWRKPGNHK